MLVIPRCTLTEFVNLGKKKWVTFCQVQEVNDVMKEGGINRSWNTGRGFLARSSKAEMSRKGFSFDSSKFLDQNNHMYSVSLNLVTLNFLPNYTLW